jgi:hypothetical protein
MTSGGVFVHCTVEEGKLIQGWDGIFCYWIKHLTLISSRSYLQQRFYSGSWDITFIAEVGFPQPHQ